MTTTCPSDELIAELADGALIETERADLEAHLAGCGACARVVAELAKLVVAGETGKPMIGRYELAESIGSGGMGVVIEAWDPVLSRRVAIKIVRPDKPIACERLLAEARALAQLSDPHVLTIHDVIDGDRGVCLVTELVDGDSAAAWRERMRPAWPDVLAVYLQVARGLIAVHARGLLHRDLKPANVLVGRDGRARLGDFGLVGDGVAAVGGTPGFMPPEQAAGKPIDVRADQFALAMSIIHGVSGHVVPAGTRSDQLRGFGIPAPACDGLARAIATSPDDRFDRVAELVAALEARGASARVRWLAGAGVLGALATVAILWVRAPDAPLVARSPDAAIADAPSIVAAPSPISDAAPRAPDAAIATHRPPPPRPSREVLESALRDAIHEHDAAACKRAVADIVAIEPAFQSAHCEMIAGHCQAGMALLDRVMPHAATFGQAIDYCPADGDLDDHRLARAIAQATAGRTAASCKHRATWVTSLATTPSEAEQYAGNAIECFAAIRRCDDALAEAGVLATLRSTTAEVELARIAPACSRRDISNVPVSGSETPGD